MRWSSGFYTHVRKLLIIAGALILAACTTTQSQLQEDGMKLDPSIISVSTPGWQIPSGSKFAWMQSAIKLYEDKRLDSSSIQYLIEKNIKTNLLNMGFQFVDSESAADYTIAYTAALESSLDDTTILRRYGLVPGNMRVPEQNPNYEKGTLLIYAFDAGSRDVVWRSAVQAAVDFTLGEQERRQRIGPVIRDMFDTLPTSE